MASFIKIFNTVSVDGAQDERVNHTLPTFQRIEIAVDATVTTDKAIRIYWLSGDIEFVTQVSYDTLVAQEGIDFAASVVNIDAAVL